MSTKEEGSVPTESESDSFNPELDVTYYSDPIASSSSAADGATADGATADGGGANSNHHLRNLKIAIEYKYLMKHAPGGVFILPEFDSIRFYHGVIFVRRGLYRDGVFRFTLQLPDAYSSRNSHPLIHFTPPVYNPMVDPSTGSLDVSLEPGMAVWQPDRHFIVNALTFLKGIFYLTSYDAYDRVADEPALALFKSDQDEFRKKAVRSVRDSLSRSFDPVADNCSVMFTEPKPAHDIIKANVLQQLAAAAATATATATTAGDAGDGGAGAGAVGVVGSPGFGMEDEASTPRPHRGSRAQGEGAAPGGAYEAYEEDEEDEEEGDDAFAARLASWDKTERPVTPVKATAPAPAPAPATAL